MDTLSVNLPHLFSQTAPIIALCCIAALAIKICRVTFRKRLRYTQHDSILTKAELNFYRTLCRTVPNGYVLCPKVRIADVLKSNVKQTEWNRKEWYKSFSKISQKHFDFVICKNSDMSFACAIELNDSSHQRSDRVQRDQFVREICQSAKLPLLEVVAAKRYDPTALSKAIIRHIKDIE